MVSKPLTTILEENGFSKLTEQTFRNVRYRKLYKRVNQFITGVDPSKTYCYNERDKTFPRFIATFKSEHNYKTLNLYHINNLEVLKNVLKGKAIEFSRRKTKYHGKRAMKRLAEITYLSKIQQNI